MSGKNGIRKRKPRKHKKKSILFRLLIVLCVIAAGAAVWNLEYFKVGQIAVIGNRTLSDKEIVRLARVHEGESIFSVNPFLVQYRIKRNLYVRKARVQWDMPNTVKISVREREGAAQFEKQGKKAKFYVVTDSEGMVMDTWNNPQDVTMVENVTVTKSEDGKEIRVKETTIYEKSMELISKAAEADLYFKRVSVSGSRVEAWIYDDLSCRGRYTNMLRSMENGELKSVVYRLYQQDVRKGTIIIGDNNYCSFTPEN